MSRYNDLIDVGLNVDVTGLQDKLGEIDTWMTDQAKNLASLDKQVSELQNGKDIDRMVEDAVQAIDFDEKIGEYLGNTSTLAETIDEAVRDAGLVDEDRVQEMLASKVEMYVSDHLHELHFVTLSEVNDAIDDRDLLDEDKVKDIFRDMAHDEGEDMVIRIVDNMDFVTSDDIAQVVADHISNNSLMDDDEVDEKISNALSEFEPDIDIDEIVGRVVQELPEDEDAKRETERLERKFDQLDTRFRDHANGVYARFDVLERRFTGAADEEKVRNLERRIDQLVRDLAEVKHESEQALNFFDLLRRAAQILGNLGIGGRA